MQGKNIVAAAGLMSSLLINAAALAQSQAWKGQAKLVNTDTQATADNKGMSVRKRRVTTSSSPTTAKPVKTRCDPAKQEPADLSGTYNGVVTYPEAGFNGEATLAITGNQFLLTIGNAAQTGRITAVTTCNYTAATMMFGEAAKSEPGRPAPPPLPVISLRAVKKGTGVTLTSVTGERRTFSFVPKAAK